MRNFILGLGLFLLQLWLTFKGSPLLGKYWNPVALCLVSLAIPYFFLRAHLNTEKTAHSPTRLSWLWALGGLFTIALSYEELRKLFVKFSPPRDFSDVLPQLETLYQRFHSGVFPYAPVDMGSYQPYPVYMPLNWLPIGIAETLHMDTRWVGYAAYGLATALFAFLLPRYLKPNWQTISALLLPSAALWAYILWGEMDIPVSLELLIAAYYLVLAMGLYTRSLPLITLGLVLCILSRYTLAFWLPLFALLLWQYAPRKASFWVWGTVVASFLLLYFFPFYLKDPSILSTGIQYHNHAAIDEWKGYGDPPVSWSFERGIYFAPHFKALFSGDMEHRVLLSRMVQGSLMLLLFASGFFYYKRLRERIDIYTYSLVFLYLVIAVFYFFGPLTYRYYLVVLFALSAVLCGSLMTLNSNKTGMKPG